MPFLPPLRAGSSLLDVFKAFPGDQRSAHRVSRAAAARPSPFTEAERELIAAYVSGLNGCRYCHGVHTATAERLGVAQKAVQQLVNAIDTAPVQERMKPVLRYAQNLMAPT